MSYCEDDSDQGFSALSAGCSVWPCHRERLERRRGHAGGWWWKCPKCGGSYGEAKHNDPILYPLHSEYSAQEKK